ncbi:MAG: hypothetical protein HY678_03155 [Chloroflexi bacterium]|nr:hypothetical protein [Chloroflexota bacterium]
MITTITQRGQVTIPVEVRRALGVEPRDEIAFRMEDGSVRLAAVTFTFESHTGRSNRPDVLKTSRRCSPRSGLFSDAAAWI